MSWCNASTMRRPLHPFAACWGERIDRKFWKITTSIIQNRNIGIFPAGISAFDMVILLVTTILGARIAI
jgi:hypothetical protein